MDASEGGNQPQRVLLVGGPKHGEFMNLPEDEVAYEFVSDRALSTSPSSILEPRTASHRYRYDPVLSAVAGRCNLFTHEVLWDSPVQGGFNLHALREAERAILDAKKELEARRQEVERLEHDAKIAEGDFESLLAGTEIANRKLDAVRLVLERIGTDVITTMQLTGRDYESPFAAVGGLQSAEEHDAEPE